MLGLLSVPMVWVWVMGSLGFVQGQGPREGDLGPAGWSDLAPLRVDATRWVVRRPLTASQTLWSISRRLGLRRPQVPSSTCGR